VCEKAAWLIIVWRLYEMKIAVKCCKEKMIGHRLHCFLKDSMTTYLQKISLFFVDAIVEQLDLKKKMLIGDLFYRCLE